MTKTETIFSLSIKHLTARTIALCEVDDVTVPPSYVLHQGLADTRRLLVAMTHEGSQLGQRDMLQCLAVAATAGADWLLFGEDEPLLPILPIYERNRNARFSAAQLGVSPAEPDMRTAKQMLADYRAAYPNIISAYDETGMAYPKPAIRGRVAAWWQRVLAEL